MKLEARLVLSPGILRNTLNACPSKRFSPSLVPSHRESLVILLYAEHRVVRQAVLYLVMPEIMFLGVGNMPGGERKQEQYEYSFFQRGRFVR